MNWGLTACVLIRVHARSGQWLTVDELATHLMVPPAELRAHLAAMAENKLLHLRRDGTDGADGEISHVRAAVAAA